MKTIFVGFNLGGDFETTANSQSFRNSLKFFNYLENVGVVLYEQSQAKIWQ